MPIASTPRATPKRISGRAQAADGSTQQCCGTGSATLQHKLLFVLGDSIGTEPDFQLDQDLNKRAPERSFKLPFLTELRCK